MMNTDKIFKKTTHNAAPVLTIAHLITVTTIKTVSDLVDGTTPEYKASNFIPIPNFLVKEVNCDLRSSNGDAKADSVKIV